jgi:hypothetical protein
MTVPSMNKLSTVFPIMIEKYEQFIPNIEGMGVPDKINAIIQYLNRIGKLSNDVVADWNKVMVWVMDEGLSDSVNMKIDDLISKGTFDELLSSSFENKVNVGHTDYNGVSSDNPMIEIGVIGAGAALHLLAGDTMTAPYVLGIGVDHDGKTGQTISVKADNCTGLGIDLTSTSGPNSVGLYADVIGSGTVIRLAQGGGAHGSLLDLRNDYGGSGNMLSWASANQGYFGKISQDGSIVRTLGVSGQDHQLISTVGSSHNESHYHYSGTPNLWFYSGIVSYSNRLVLQQAAPSAIGSEIPLKLIELKDGNAIGFYGVEPVTRQVVANTTDVSNTATQLNALLSVLRNMGLVA